MPVRYITKIDDVPYISEEEKEKIKRVVEKYPFRVSEYYLNLIDWQNPKDPLRKIVMPNENELYPWGYIDPSEEKRYTVMPGVEHKYPQTVLILSSNVCGGICRFCFRKRLFMKGHIELLTDLPALIKYLKKHREVTNVLLSGGDPLMLSTEKLAKIIKAIRKIDHIDIIRLGTKIPVYNPYRILEDPALLDLIRNNSLPQKKIYVITDINHPKELTEVSIEAINALLDSGAILANQTPLIKGLNDSVDTLSNLFKKLASIGVPPYYIFQCRPAVGNRYQAVPIEKGFDIIEETKGNCSGLAKRARFIMSHRTGKIEIVGKDKENIYMKYMNAADPRMYGKLLVFRRNPSAYWLEDYINSANKKEFSDLLHSITQKQEIV